MGHLGYQLRKVAGNHLGGKYKCTSRYKLSIPHSVDHSWSLEEEKTRHALLEALICLHLDCLFPGADPGGAACRLWCHQLVLVHCCAPTTSTSTCYLWNRDTTCKRWPWRFAVSWRVFPLSILIINYMPSSLFLFQICLTCSPWAPRQSDWMRKKSILLAACPGQ